MGSQLPPGYPGGKETQGRTRKCRLSGLTRDSRGPARQTLRVWPPPPLPHRGTRHLLVFRVVYKARLGWRHGSLTYRRSAAWGGRGGGAQCCTYSPSCRQPRLLTGRAGPGGILRGRTQKMPLEGGGTGWGNGAQLGASGQLCCSAVAGERLTQHPTLRPLGFCNDRRVGGL